MGIYTDLLASAKSFTPTSRLAQYLEERKAAVDPVAPSLAAVIDAVQALSASTMTAGNFTLTFRLRDGTTFTTGSIVFNALAAAIETIIDTAASGVVTGWANGDITVGGTGVEASFSVTFDGTSVAGDNHQLTVLNDVDGTGGAWGVPSTTTPGQTVRNAIGVLIALGVLDSAATLPQQSQSPADPSLVTLASDFGKTPTDIILDLMTEVAYEDKNNNSYFTLVKALFSGGEKAPQVESIGRTAT